MTVTAERWLPVEGYEGAYEVSDQGRVRSLDRTIQTKRGPRRVAGRVLKPKLHTGYAQIAPGFGQCAYVHHWVMEAFVGPRPVDTHICHTDGDPSNNHLSNLRYDTPSVNSLDAVLHGRNYQALKTHCPAGHPYDESNTYLRSGNRRACRSCGSARSIRRYRQRRRTAA